MSDYKKKTRDWIRHRKLSILPAPDRILIKITRKQMDDLISKEIILDDGTKKRLFFEPILHDPGYDRRYRQNVSVGEIIGVGDNVGGVKVGDVIILDYLVSADETDDLVGFFNKDRVISILAETTYHKDSAPIIHGHAGWIEGDFDNISRILGVVRGDNLIPFDPYVFLEYKSDLLKIVSIHGENIRSKESVYERTVLSVPEGCSYKSGDVIRIKNEDLFEREVNGHTISIAFKNDILCKLNDTILSK